MRWDISRYSVIFWYFISIPSSLPRLSLPRVYMLYWRCHRCLAGRRLWARAWACVRWKSISADYWLLLLWRRASGGVCRVWAWYINGIFPHIIIGDDSCAPISSPGKCASVISFIPRHFQIFDILGLPWSFSHWWLDALRLSSMKKRLYGWYDYIYDLFELRFTGGARMFLSYAFFASSPYAYASVLFSRKVSIDEMLSAFWYDAAFERRASRPPLIALSHDFLRGCSTKDTGATYIHRQDKMTIITVGFRVEIAYFQDWSRAHSHLG